MMSKNFFRGCDNLETAEYKFSKSKQTDNTEILLGSACFHLQQSMEFFLKTLVELTGQAPVQNHNLRANLNRLSREQIEDLKDIIDTIDIKSTIYNDWEVDSRYNDNFVVLVSDIQEAIEICHCLKSYIDGQISFKPLDKQKTI